MMSDTDIIEVVATHAAGKPIEGRNHTDRIWEKMAIPGWNFGFADYRVAPEPRKPREWTVVIAPDSVITSHNPMEAVKAFSWEMIRVREVID